MMREDRTAHSNAPDVAIRFEQEAFDISRPWLMGRQMAGHGFLRAMVAGRGDKAVIGYGPPQAADAFAQMVRAMDPGAASGWLPHNRPNALGAVDVCFRGDPALLAEARLRLRANPAAYSLCGVTHTTATSGTMAQLAALLSGPLTPWDAVVCTSQAVVETVRHVHAAEADYLRWRFGRDVPIDGPQLPMIPLGVHCDDFADLASGRAEARAELRIAEDEVAALFVGRLAFIAKAHPAQMFQALQQAHLRTGQRIVLVLCGWSPNALISRGLQEAAAALCPNVRVEFVDGRDIQRRDTCLAASDIFISLSDNIQETFGLTPLEAMASGLPVLVTDWNGYRDTVRHGVDGFRTPTWAPAAGAGGDIARDYEIELLDYDRYVWWTVASTSCVEAELVEQLCALIEHPQLRARMGASGRRRARETFDWPVIYRQYQALWAELKARRAGAVPSAAPRAASHALDPFLAFGHYPTHQIGPDTAAALAAGATSAAFEARLALTVFRHALVDLAVLRAVFAALEKRPASVAELAGALACPWSTACHAVGLLAKMGLVVLSRPDDP